MGLSLEQTLPDSCEMFSCFKAARKCFNQVAERGRNSDCSGAKSRLEPGTGTGFRCPVEEGRERPGPACGTPGEAVSAEASRPAALASLAGIARLAGLTGLSWAGVNLFELGFLSRTALKWLS